MPLSLEQYETWSHQGAIATSKDTYHSISNSIANILNNMNLSSHKIFLQGSYGNDTNVWKESDVDVVVMLENIYSFDVSQLPQDQRTLFDRDFRVSNFDLVGAKQKFYSELQRVYGYTDVSQGNKSIKINGVSGRRNADIVFCNQYRFYKTYHGSNSEDYYEGIYFKALNGHAVVNYPQLHSKNCTRKHQETNSAFKGIVRIIKNIRNKMLEGGLIPSNIAPSYFLEGMMYNLPSNIMQGVFKDATLNSLKNLNNSDLSRFVLPNKMSYLFGDADTQWNMQDCKTFAVKAMDFLK